MIRKQRKTVSAVQLKKTLQNMHDTLRGILGCDNIWCDTALYGYLRMAEAAVIYAEINVGQLRVESNDEVEDV